MMLSLGHAQAVHLAQMAEAAFPREACALLVGREHGDGMIEVAEIVAGDNVATSPEREFEFDPAMHIALLRRLREANAPERPVGPKLIGVWHSHPNGRAEPSAKDAAMANDPGLVWAISAVTDGKAGAPCAYRLKPHGGFEKLPVEIVKQET